MDRKDIVAELRKLIDEQFAVLHEVIDVFGPTMSETEIAAYHQRKKRIDALLRQLSRDHLEKH